MNKQSGFTLIELMISIVLGLLITAATIQLLSTSQRTVVSQQAGSDIQDSGLFGVETIARSLRMANYGAKGSKKFNKYVMNDRTGQGGIVFTSPDDKDDTKDSNLNGVMSSSGKIKESLLTQSSIGPSNVDGSGSDQLVIQRQVVGDTYDCQGGMVNAGSYLVERYFLRSEDPKLVDPNEPNPLVLACVAANYSYNPTLVPSNGIVLSNDLSGEGDVIFNRVDNFKVMFGVETNPMPAVDPSANNIVYMTAQQYKALPVIGPEDTPRPRIVTVKFSILARSDNPVTSGPTNLNQRFNMLNERDVPLTDAVNAPGVPRYKRQVYEASIIIRNARGNA